MMVQPTGLQPTGLQSTKLDVHCDRFIGRESNARRGIVFSASEQRVLRSFRRFQVAPGQMLCFSGPELKQLQTTFQSLVEKEVLVKEKFKGGYSLTAAGFAALSNCE